MAKFCIFDSSKLCDNCGECNRCDLIPTKKCDNCGKCLELEGYDTKAINIEEILEENEDIEDMELSLDEKDNETDGEKDSIIDDLSELNKDLQDSEIHVEYIDDIDGLNEILEGENHSSNLIDEVFPGFITLKTSK